MVNSSEMYTKKAVKKWNSFLHSPFGMSYCVNDSKPLASSSSRAELPVGRRAKGFEHQGDSESRDLLLLYFMYHGT